MRRNLSALGAQMKKKNNAGLGVVFGNAWLVNVGISLYYMICLRIGVVCIDF